MVAGKLRYLVGFDVILPPPFCLSLSHHRVYFLDLVIAVLLHLTVLSVFSNNFDICLCIYVGKKYIHISLEFVVFFLQRNPS